MKTWCSLAAAVGLGLVLACGGSSSEAQGEVEDRIDSEVAAAQEDAASEEAAVAGAPRVSERYQSTINRGWEEAVAGETPAYACAGLKGRLMGTGTASDPEALEALYACNVLLPVRYFETHLDQIEAGDKTCQDLMMALATQLSAMTLSIDSIEGMTEAFAGEPEAAAADTVAAAVDAATLEEGLTDPERQVKDRLEERVQATCPDLAPVILR